MFRSQIDQVRQNTHGFAERAARILEARRDRTPLTLGAVLQEGSGGWAAALQPADLSPDALGRHGQAEAVVLSALRPAFFVTSTGIEVSGASEADPDLLDLVTSNCVRLHRASMGVGRVDLLHHPALSHAGTGFLIDDRLAVTSREVALAFAERLQGSWHMRPGRFETPLEVRLDYHHHVGSSSQMQAEVTEVLYIAGDQEPDFALLRVARQEEAPPLDLLGGRPLHAKRQAVALVGYPSTDGNQAADPLFSGPSGVKRLAPGFVTGDSHGDLVLAADYSSLGGSAGAPVLSLEDGKVLGLHVAGRFMESNRAVAADVVDAARRRILVSLPGTAIPQAQIQIQAHAQVSPASDFTGRNGFDPDFLGTGNLRVPLPGLGPWKAAPVRDSGDDVLRYRNFSVIQSAARRLPLVTAVNIDGAQSRMLKRRGAWRLDGRLDPAHQVGNELYVNNALDRGHMVRRRDPGWGPDAEEGESDTFHYTNCAPQHENLNQKHWLGLEDYILEAAETRGFRVSVLTGPVLRDTDRRLKTQPGTEDIAIPEEFWKIAVMVHAETGQLTATGYVLSQGRMIRPLVQSAFVYGRYETYQVRIALIAAETGLDFGLLPSGDPLGADLPREAAFPQVAHVIDGPHSLVLTKQT